MYNKDFTQFDPHAPKLFSILPNKYTSAWGTTIIFVIGCLILGIFVFNVISEPVVQPYLYGVKTSPEAISEAKIAENNPFEVFIGERLIKAYSPSIDENHGNPCVGAWGDNLCEMLVNGDYPVATNEFTHATKLLINDIIYIVSDTTPYDDNRIEIFMASKNEAKDWGNKYLDVSIIRL